MTRIAINGAAGRMGQMLMETCLSTQGLTLSAAIEHSGHHLIGKDIGLVIGQEMRDLCMVDHIETVVDDFDLLIDFTHPSVSLNALAICEKHAKAMVIGTTGFTAEEKQAIGKAAQTIPIVFAPNMSIGVNLCFKLAELAAKVIGSDSDIEIIEAHHRNKVDAPSGTALKFGEVIAQTLNRSLDDCAVYGRQGQTGVRDKQTIGFETIRAGDIVGDHTVMFADIGERIEITHRASNRNNYGKGAMRAALWLRDKKNGLFDMQDVLEL